MNDREKVIKYTFEQLKARILDEKIEVQKSTEFCILTLSSMPNNKEYIINCFYKKLDEILPEIIAQKDFIIAIKLLDVFLQGENQIGNLIVEKAINKITNAIRKMPDDLWKVRVMSQLSEKVLEMVLNKFDNKELNALLYICPQIINSELIEKNIKNIIEGQGNKKKIILRKKR